LSGSPWLSVSEKERIEELLLSGSLVIPPPQINIAVFQNIALDFKNAFTVGLVHGAGALLGFGALEGAMTLAALGAWAQSQRYSEADLVQALRSGASQNPLEVALRQFIAHGQITGSDALAMQTFLRQQAVPQAALQTVSPDTLQKAFQLAQQQLVIALLQKWNAIQAQLAILVQQNMTQQDVKEAEKKRQLLSEYLQKSEIKQEALRQPVVSMLIGALIADVAVMASVAALIPIATAGAVTLIPAAISVDLGVLAAGVISSTLLWSAPIAMSFTSYAPGNEAQISKDSAKAFALTLASLITNPKFDEFLNSSIGQALASGQITEGKAETISASFKISLLLMAMALLYKSDTGGVSAGELRGIVTGEISLGESDFLGTLGKLVNEQLKAIDPAERDRLLDQLLAPFDKDPSFSGLVNPLSSFISGWNPQCLRDSTLASRG
jgi:hypothetical protein